MSLIPFILDLADELQDFQRCLVSGCSAMDVDDIDFGLYPFHETNVHQQQQQQQQRHDQKQQQHDQQQQQHDQQQQPHYQQSQQQHRRPRLLSQLFWQPNILQKQQHYHHHRHHPYNHERFCCNIKEKETNGIGEKLNAANTLVGLANKRAAYPLVKKNGWVMVSMNVKQFTPDELTVKTVDNCIIIEGRHEDKEDIHGVISRHFIRKYLLPKGYDPNDVVSTLSSDGILTVKAPPPKIYDEGTIRIVDIQQTGPTHSAAKDTRATADCENSSCSSTNTDTNESTNRATITTAVISTSSEQPKTSIDTSLEKETLIEIQTVEDQERQQKQQQQQQQQLQPSSSLSLALEVENEGSDLVEDASLLEQVEQETHEDENNEKDMKNECGGLNTAIIAPTVLPATEILAESANPNSEPIEETEESVSPVDAVVCVEMPIATETDATTGHDVDMTVNNGAKIQADDIERNVVGDGNDDGNGDGNGDGDGEVEVDELTFVEKEKNGDMTMKSSDVLVSAVLPSEVDVAVPSGKDVCVSKSVVIEAAATANCPTVGNADNENENDNDHDIDTNGRPGIVETLGNTSEELVAN